MATDHSTALTVEQQARLTSGRDFWTTEAEGGARSIMLTDGPHGLRKQDGATDNLGLAGSIPATCFPPAVGLAQTWNAALAGRLGAAIAAEARAAQVAVVLGPGINLKRSPLGGRNFEYFSEDPVLTAQLAAAWVRGLQDGGVGASLKHFAANNQETDRMRVSADIDQRTLHELYLRAFRSVVRRSEPWTVMCSYNRINGVHAFADRTLLTGLLRERWGFGGLVVSDWGAVADRVAAVAAGLDLTMPFPGDADDAALAAAVREHRLDPAALRTCADRVRALAERAGDPDPAAEFDADEHHRLAREAAGQAIVLLRNQAVARPGDPAASPLLPLDPGDDLVVIGELAATPRYQGGGSSHVNATRVDVPLDELRRRSDGRVDYHPGYTTGEPDPALADAAVAAARSTGTVVLFLGLAARQESEGFDRTSLDLPADQLSLAARVLEANPRTAVVLCHGGVVDLSGIDAPALLDAALLGQAVGSAITDVLYGDVNPSGRLAETVPVRLQDTPAYLNFPGEHGHVTYGEGLFIGYRWYDARELDVTFPFGHGLSYTDFQYSGLAVTAAEDGITVRVTVANTGHRDGREVVQVYVGTDSSAVARPPRELKAFANVQVPQGESTEVTLDIAADDLAYWDTRFGDFVVEPGTYTVAVGASSRDLRLTATVDLDGDPRRPDLTAESTIAEVLASPEGAEAFAPIIEAMASGMGAGEESSGEAMGVDLAAMMGSIPIGRLVAFSGGMLPREALQQLLDQANAAARP
ncbi:glycoside hydrolase family 3 C-terminal domain-containing protein [Gordonia caeni]|uniref:Glycoside hydrolase family 3 C-terminal domain-containing protein n=1 Tax=Gordonia caeni TaxID=1007097 RepID=A0ABP7NUK4_9ACTN